MNHAPQNPPSSEVGTRTDEVCLPVNHAAHSLKALTIPAMPDFTLKQAVRELADSMHVESIHPLANTTRTLLIAQARVLDSLFNRLVIVAQDRPYVDNDRVDLALRAQRQCCQTITALEAVKRNRGNSKI